MANNNTSEYSQQITNYLSRDFNTLKASLINYTKTYFPNVYQDFNETSPGMMLLELNAYVGDVLNYYVDDSFKEMMLPLTEDRRNLLNLSKVTGYKPRPIVPSFADITFTLTVDANTTDLNKIIPDANQFITLREGVKLTSTSNPDVIFETMEPVDFSTSSSIQENFKVESVNADSGLIEKFSAKRKVRAVSGETKTTTIAITQPEQFKKIILPDSNVIEIISVTDSNNNIWYEVDYLAQENVPVSTYYALDPNRVSSYTDPNNTNLPVPYSLSFVKSTKRFMTEMQEDNRVALIFGNGIAKSGYKFETTFLDIEQEGVTLPKTNFSPEPLNTRIGRFYASLGEAPSNTSLTITYRVGGGQISNVPANDLTSFSGVVTIPVGGDTSNLTVTNEFPSLGGREADSTEEIRHSSIANYSTQNRCVTKEDYEARTISMLPRFGSIAKVYCSTGGELYKQDNVDLVTELQELFDDVILKMLETGNSNLQSSAEDIKSVDLSDLINRFIQNPNMNHITSDDRASIFEKFDLLKQFTGTNRNLPTVDLYVLSYDFNGNLCTSTDLIKRNIKNFLSQFRILSDKIRIIDGYIINFGVLFDVLAYPNFDKTIIKTKCIDAIKKHYNVKTMQFKELLYTSEITSLLSKIEGVKAVNDVIFTQDEDFTSSNNDGQAFSTPLYSKSVNVDGLTTKINDNNYGHKYNFKQFFVPIAETPQGRGVVLPSVDPNIFEIKNMNTDIKGVVR